MTDFSVHDELSHRAHGVLDRHVGVGAVLIVEIHMVHAEPDQRRINGRSDVFRAAIGRAGAAPVVVGTADDAELGGDTDLATDRGEDPAEELLVVAETVDIGGVKQGDAEVDRAMQRRGGLVTVDRAVGVAHTHAAEANRGSGQAQGAELAGGNGHAPTLGMAECDGRGCGPDQHPAVIPGYRCTTEAYSRGAPEVERDNG